MSRFVVLILLLSSLNSWNQENSQDLVLERKSQKCGESGLLKWSIPTANNVYIIGLGSVASQGEMRVNPTTTRKYTLLADTPSGSLQSEAEFVIASSCSRGPEEYPQVERFRNRLRFDRPISSLPRFLSGIHGVLQNTLGFAVDEFSDSTSQFVFVTTLNQRGDLVRKDETNIGARRLSYLVTVKMEKDEPRSMSYTIATLIEYRRRIESTWRTENDSELHHEQAENLRRLIDSIK